MAASGSDLSFRLLGSVGAWCDGRPVRLGGRKPRAVLAALLYHANEVLDLDRLISLVWGPDADVGRDTVYHYLHGLRTALAPAKDQVWLDSLRPNYRLCVTHPAQVVDWHTFCTLVTEAGTARQIGEPDRARTLLRQALACWHGEALADIGDALPGIRRAMTMRRLGAAEDLAELELRHGDPGQVVDILSELCERHSERERAAALLVRAFGALGLRDDAMAVYQRTRSHVISAHGVDPYGLLEAAYRTLVDSPAPTANRQAMLAGLPRLDRHFVGRQDELARLRDVLTRRLPIDEESGGPVICIHGMAGVGKTQLALRAAHGVADRFPDGALFVDLRGYTPDERPLDPAIALSRLLGQLGMPEGRVPDDMDARATRYRATVAGKMMLIVLDNARTASQVRPLLPAAPGCRVIITSRSHLTALDDTVPIGLDVLPPTEAGELFGTVAGISPVTADGDIASVVSRCGGLPMAIRIVAARYRDQAWATLRELDARLADPHDRLMLFDDGERSLGPAFTASYQSLPADQQEMFRLLGLFPVLASGLDVYAAAALAGIALPAAQHLLDRLYASSLLTQPAASRYALHDLLGDYATRIAEQVTEADRRAALTRLFDLYCHLASVAMAHYAPYEPHRRPPTPPRPEPVPQITSKSQARAWLDTHQRILLAAAGYAAEHGWPQYSTHLSRTLFRYLEESSLPYAEKLALYDAALHAARRIEDRTAEAHIHNDLAAVHFRHDRADRALDELQEALRLNRDLGDAFGEGRTLGNLATVHGTLHNVDDAIDHHQQAVRRYVELGDRASETRAITNLCSLYVALGRYDEAIDHLNRALAQDVGDRAVRGSALAMLANSYWGLGRYDEAVGYHEHALALQRETGNSSETTETLNDFARTLRDVDRHDDALTRCQEALALARQADNDLEAARAHDGIARFHTHAGRPGQAQECWRQALALLAGHESPVATELRADITAQLHGSS